MGLQGQEGLGLTQAASLLILPRPQKGLPATELTPPTQGQRQRAPLRSGGWLAGARPSQWREVTAFVFLPLFSLNGVESLVPQRTNCEPQACADSVGASEDWALGKQWEP